MRYLHTFKKLCYFFLHTFINKERTKLSKRTFNENDVDELLVDKALSDDDIIELLDPVLDPENNSYVEDSEPAPLTAKIIREGLQLCNSLENHFINNDPNSERAFKFQRDLKNCISGYQELLKQFQKSSQSLITDFVVKEAKQAVEISTGCNEGELISSPELLTIYSSDDSDFVPVNKRSRALPTSEDND